MRANAVLFAVAVCALIAGCDWEFSGSEGSWSGSYESVNFSGVYRGPEGVAVASGLTTTPGGTMPVAIEITGIADGTRTSYSGVLRNRPVDPGSVTLVAANFSFLDDGDRTLVGNTAQTSGTIVYSTGRWTLDFGFNAPGQGTPIRASYTYTTEGAGARTLKTLNVTQTGQRLLIEASNGAIFEGRFGGVRQSTATVTAEFSASASHGGQRIRLVGTFEGDLQAGALGTPVSVSNRRLNATWIEDGTGEVLDVFGMVP